MASTSVAVVAVVLSAGRVWPRACQLQRLLQLGNMRCMARDGRPEVGMYMSSKRAVWVFSIECCMADVLCVMYRRVESLWLERVKLVRPAGPLCYTHRNIA